MLKMEAGPIGNSQSTCGRLGPRIRSRAYIDEDLSKKINVPTIDNKIDFLRFIGLEIKKVCDVDCSTKNNDAINNDSNNNETNNQSFNGLNEISDTQTRPQQSCKLSDAIRDYKSPDYSFTCPSNVELQANKSTSCSGRTTDSQRLLESMRECSVMIVGEKCEICGRSFKCIKDVQLHVKKKHRKKKPRGKVVLLKIGKEVISRVRIRRKHLKRANHEDDRTILNGYDITKALWNDAIPLYDRINNERSAFPLIEIDDNCDTADTESHVRKITKPNVSLSPLGPGSSGSSTQCHNKDDEDVREVLRITRSPGLGPSINHETPNRMERELLLSDAIREFDRIGNDPMSIIEFVDHEPSLRDENNDIIEDYCWLARENLQNRHLDLAENNCSYHIQNDYDYDYPVEGADLFAQKLDAKYFDDERASPHPREYRRENGDVVPDYIDYAQCLLDNHRPLNNKNNHKNNITNHEKSNNTYELESPFYNEARISEWNKLTLAPDTFNCDLLARKNRNIDPSVVIKEEIILDDLL